MERPGGTPSAVTSLESSLSLGSCPPLIPVSQKRTLRHTAGSLSTATRQRSIPGPSSCPLDTRATSVPPVGDLFAQGWCHPRHLPSLSGAPVSVFAPTGPQDFLTTLFAPKGCASVTVCSPFQILPQSVTWDFAASTQATLLLPHSPNPKSLASPLLGPSCHTGSKTTLPRRRCHSP